MKAEEFWFLDYSQRIRESINTLQDKFNFADAYAEQKIESLQKQISDLQSQNEELKKDIPDFLAYCREIKNNINYPDDMVIGDFYGWWKEKQALKE